VAYFIAEFADDFNKRFDWVGIERTFQQIFQILRKRTEDQYLAQKKLFVKSKIGKVIINLVSLALLIAIIIFTPIGFRKFSEKTGYFQKETKVEDYSESLNEGDVEEDVGEDVWLKGVVSRKKQFLPAIVEALQQ